MTKETATQTVRIYPSTQRKAKIEAAKTGSTIAEVIDSKFRREN